MKHENGLFKVYKGENVTIEINPSEELGEGQAVAERDGGAEPALIFTVTKDVGQEHTVDVVYGFENAPEGSEYKITIDGDSTDNKGPFRRRVNTNSPVQPEPERSYVFSVIAKA